MCARKRQTRYLPQEMVFNLLLHLPAQALHAVMRLVCREWNLMIRSKNFIHHHLRNSTSGIIIQEPYPSFTPGDAIYVEIRRGCLEICKLDGGFIDMIWSSCNGLVLAPDSRRGRVLYVMNPLTKQRAILPSYFRELEGHSDFGLAFVEASMEYKVVHACCTECGFMKAQIAVLTVGVDKVWRHIDIKHLFRPSERAMIIRSIPLVTGGYVHWKSETFVFTMNVETETVRRFPNPQSPKIRGRYLPMGSILSYVSKSHECFRDVWEMNPETGVWTMFLSFDFEPLRF